MVKKQFTITSEVGLHARPATLLVKEASKYSSNIELEFNGKTVNLKSIMGVMALAISQGSAFSIMIDGADESDALSGIEALFTKEGIAI